MASPPHSQGELQRHRGRLAQALRAGRTIEAEQLARALLKAPAVSGEDLQQLANLGRQWREPEVAVCALESLHARQPANLPVLFDLVRTEQYFCKTQAALDHLETAAGLCTSADEFAALGELLGRAGAMERSREAYARACALAPDNHLPKFNLAVCEGFLGNLDEAERLYDELLVGGYHTGYVYQNRTWLRPQTPEANHVTELREAIDSGAGGSEGAPLLFYALGKEYEDLGDLEAAMDWYEKGAAARRRNFPGYRVEADERHLQEVARAFPQNLFEGSWEGAASAEPIFIVGMPRVGSTLLEQMLGRHSAVTPMGELANFLTLTSSYAARAARVGGARNFRAPSWYTEIPFRDLGENYVQSTRPHTGKTAHFTDKLPSNFMLCGLIAIALPKAKIVHVHRDPMDACFAMFKQSFHAGFHYSYDQRELGRVYAAYRKLMDHWDRVMPGRIIHIAYEDVVRNNEATMLDLVTRLGLDWEDACLDHRGAGVAKTASGAQVRQPLYQSSIGKWREVADRLRPLRETLERAGIAMD